MVRGNLCVGLLPVADSVTKALEYFVGASHRRMKCEKYYHYIDDCAETFDSLFSGVRCNPKIFLRMIKIFLDIELT